MADPFVGQSWYRYIRAARSALKTRVHAKIPRLTINFNPLCCTVGLVATFKAWKFECTKGKVGPRRGIWPTKVNLLSVLGDVWDEADAAKAAVTRIAGIKSLPVS